MIKLSKLTDYAVAILAQLSRTDGGKVASCAYLSEMTGVPEPTVAKVLKILTKTNLVGSARGIKGGYKLDRPASDIKVADIIVAMDGPIAVTACVEGGTHDCAMEAKCPVRGNWDRVNRAVRAALEAVTLADLAQPAPCQTMSVIAFGEETRAS